MNAALFDNRPLSLEERAAVSAWIADRQGLPGSYAGMFAPTSYDYAFGALTFTGEPVLSAAGTGHVLSEEACRVLFRLGADSLEVREALKRARRGIFHRLEQAEARGADAGVYCCGSCSVALWRHLSASGSAEDERRLENGLRALNHHRDEKGRWKRFPFHYTLLALSAIELPAARAELDYAAQNIERALRRLTKTDPGDLSRHDLRRKILMERILEIC